MRIIVVTLFFMLQNYLQYCIANTVDILWFLRACFKVLYSKINSEKCSFLNSRIVRQ
jgi:hypothetical protein